MPPAMFSYLMLSRGTQQVLSVMEKGYEEHREEMSAGGGLSGERWPAKGEG